ncbi:hypothetical protein [Actinomadura opuntiae]|uniref:hypothetical protein n=1 Tax=Actinomadura sp. OS1-43 TaxID=604315 RepID=UPI00255B2B3B|nr:hypothetical protein [Actinomadura sp. OS1-43]MDL4821579.1 hypothetical protein [Actinomadura sp. OS1-43]
MGSTHHLGRAAGLPRAGLALAVAAVLVLPLAAGCKAGRAGASGDGDRAAAPASLDELAARTGCDLVGRRKAQQLQQGNCRNSRGQYVLVSFTSDQGMNAWLNEAKPWGGTYLVGTRWVAVSTQATLQSLRKDLGGHIQSGDMHGMSHS